MALDLGARAKEPKQRSHSGVESRRSPPRPALCGSLLVLFTGAGNRCGIRTVAASHLAAAPSSAVDPAWRWPLLACCWSPAGRPGRPRTRGAPRPRRRIGVPPTTQQPSTQQCARGVHRGLGRLYFWIYSFTHYPPILISDPVYSMLLIDSKLQITARLYLDHTFLQPGTGGCRLRSQSQPKERVDSRRSCSAPRPRRAASLAQSHGLDETDISSAEQGTLLLPPSPAIAFPTLPDTRTLLTVVALRVDQKKLSSRCNLRVGWDFLDSIMGAIAFFCEALSGRAMETFIRRLLVQGMQQRSTAARGGVHGHGVWSLRARARPGELAQLCYRGALGVGAHAYGLGGHARSRVSPTGKTACSLFLLVKKCDVRSLCKFLNSKTEYYN